MKKCSKCLETKQVELFSRSSKYADGVQVWCKECVSAYDRARYLNTDRPKKVRVSSDKTRIRNRALVNEYLLNNPCVDCGNTDLRVLQFDHRDRSTKTGMISLMVHNASVKTLMSEIDKCDVRCANCHMIRTGEQFKWHSSLALVKW